MSIPSLFRSKVSLLLACLALGAASAQAQAQALLRPTSGGALLEGRSVADGTLVPAGARVSTSEGGRVELRFPDGQRLLLGPNTELVLREYHYLAQQPQDDRITVELQRGTLRSISGALGARSPHRFSLQTPSATLGIRGTDFVVSVQAQSGGARGQTLLAVRSGVVQMASVVDFSVSNLGEGAAANAAPQSSQFEAGQVALTSPQGEITVLAPGAVPADMQNLLIEDAGVVGPATVP